MGPHAAPEHFKDEALFFFLRIIRAERCLEDTLEEDDHEFMAIFLQPELIALPYSLDV